MRNKPDDGVDLSRVHPSAKAAIEAAIGWLNEQLAKPSFTVKLGSAKHTFMRRNLPYFIHNTDLPGVQLLVNREYKPVGSTLPHAGPYVNYNEYTNLHVSLSPAEIQAVVSPPHLRGLYGDANSPWQKKSYAREYVARLQKLRALLP